ncbi:hypothetical protein BG004_003722 [Podila humilis]|nr:hypothetical protein BG004_003722 [Podila humilis]
MFQYHLSTFQLCQDVFKREMVTFAALSASFVQGYIFKTPFHQILKLMHHSEDNLLDLVGDMLEAGKSRLFKQGCLPKFENNTRLLVVNNETQLLGDQFKGLFKSSTDSEGTP